MKSLVLFIVVFIAPIELRPHNDERLELDDLLNQYDRVKHRPNKQEYEGTVDTDTDDDNDGQYVPASYEHKKSYPSRKEVLPPEEENINNEPLPSKSTQTDSSTCLDKYEIRSEQLIKVKELKNGAHMIRYDLLDKRTLSSTLTIKEHCMLNCCSQKTCDVAVLNDQPSLEGYNCSLFACSDSCTFASHQDYTIMLPKKDPTHSMLTKMREVTTSTTMGNAEPPSKKSFFRDTGVINFLIVGLIVIIFGLIFIIILFMFHGRHYPESQKPDQRQNNTPSQSSTPSQSNTPSESFLTTANIDSS